MKINLPTQPGACRFAAAVALLLVLASSLRVMAAAGDSIFLDVIVNNRFFGSNTAPSISVRTRTPVQQDLLVYDLDNRLVRALHSDSNVSKWDFTLADLPAVEKGICFFWLVATDSAGARAGIYPVDPGGGEIIEVRDSALNEEKHTITYTLPKAAVVRLRAGFHEGPYLQPIISSQAQLAGPHEVSWDGSCQNGLFVNLYRHPGVQVNALAVSLPLNVLVNQAQAASTGDNSPAEAVPGRVKDLSTPPANPRGQSIRSAFKIQDDYDLALDVKLDDVTRTVEVRVDCAPADRPKLLNRRFELMLFLDTAFLMEDERSQLPFTYRMSTRGLTPGKHIFTVNTVDGDGNVGTKSAEFTVRKPGEGS